MVSKINLLGYFFISLFFIEVFLVATVFPDMPAQYFLIGLSFLVIGAVILLYNMLRTGASVHSKVLVTTDGVQLVTDEEMRGNYRKAKIMFFGGWAVSAVSAYPTFAETIRYGNLTMVGFVFAVSTALGLIGLWSIYKYKTDPEGYRQFLAKRWKRV